MELTSHGGGGSCKVTTSFILFEPNSSIPDLFNMLYALKFIANINVKFHETRLFPSSYSLSLPLYTCINTNLISKCLHNRPDGYILLKS